MVNGLFTARNSMINLQRKVDNTTHNLANAQTTAFKRSLTAAHARVDVGRNDEWLLHQDEHQRLDENRISWQQGNLIQTNNPLDFALEGKGFFVVETNDGPRYTRAGAFARNGMGELATLTGQRVLDEGGRPIPLEGGRVALSVDGVLSVDDKPVATLAVVDFQDLNSLERQGGNLYAQRDPLAETPRPAAEFRVRQGSLEASNVNVVESMVELIRFQRNYDLDQRSILAIDETLSKAVNEIGRVN